MATESSGRMSASLLVAALVIAIAVFGVPARYSAPTSLALTVAQLLLIGGAALGLLVPAWRSGSEAHRQLAIVGTLFIIPWALLTLMPGYGPPFAASPAMNHVRFIILFVSAAFIGAAFVALRDPMVESGERLFAPLGQAAGLLGTAVQLVWAGIMIGSTMPEARPANYVRLYGSALGNGSDVLLFFAGLLTYVATLLYALSMRRAGWLGTGKAVAMTCVSAIAVLVLVVRGLAYPDLSEQWYMAPGMIVGIPAIPWLMPYLIGIAVLLRASRHEQALGRD